MKKIDAKLFLALHLLLLLYACTSILSKLAAGQEALLPLLGYLAAMVLCLGIYALGWQQILKRLPLTVAYTNKAVTLVWSLVFGVLVFHESVSVKQLIGCALAVAGVVLFVRPEKGESHDP